MDVLRNSLSILLTLLGHLPGIVHAARSIARR
ncbi:MAG: YqaE/Pmp3 family membrane protein [Paracoccaceae bacterium]|jgi:uncharacterized membrane protein YqaE (UPF0057 family)|nr:YqaE/Pmp3 family membrane protein [Paracoccaceae bacterium]